MSDSLGTFYASVAREALAVAFGLLALFCAGLLGFAVGAAIVAFVAALTAPIWIWWYV